MADSEKRVEFRKRAIFCIVGIVALALATALTKGFLSAVIVGAVVVFAGLSLLKSKESQTRIVGLVIALAGALLMIKWIPLLGWIASIILGFVGFVLVVLAVYNIIMLFSTK